MALVNVYDENGEVVATVKCNNNLDTCNGNNWNCGALGHHKGLTKLRNGQLVLIHSSQWQGDEDKAEIISEQRAVQEILKSGNDKLLEQFGFVQKAENTLSQEL